MRTVSRTVSISWRKVALISVGTGVLAWLFLASAADAWSPVSRRKCSKRGKNSSSTNGSPAIQGPRDGLGPVFNANSCVACHFQGGIGAAATSLNNVVAYESTPPFRDKKLHKGLVHAFAVNKEYTESHALLSKTFPIIPAATESSAAARSSSKTSTPSQNGNHQLHRPFRRRLIDRLSETANSP